MTNAKRILKLTMRWYKYVNMGLYKDIDCHWYLHKQWSYGETPKYHIEHNGYVYESNNPHIYKTKSKAETALVEEIKKAFLVEYNWSCNIVNDKGYDIQHEQAQWLIDNYEKIKAI